MTATKAKPADIAAKWNTDHPIGTPVLYWPGTLEGPGRPSKTRTPAWVVGGHSAVVAVDGYTGGIALTHVTVLDALELFAEVEGLRAEVAALRQTGRATFTEYGVKTWSKALGGLHVDACDDLPSALSTLRMTQKKIDMSALLVSREVPAPGPAGAWRPVPPDDVAAAIALGAAR